MTNNADFTPPAPSLFGRKPGSKTTSTTTLPNSDATHAIAADFATNPAGLADALEVVRARRAATTSATIAMNEALRVIAAATDATATPTPLHPPAAAIARDGDSMSQLNTANARLASARSARAAAAALSATVTDSPASARPVVKAPRMPLMVRELGAGKVVTLPGAAGPPFNPLDRLCLSPRDEVILWLLARYRCIAVKDLALHFGPPTSAHTLQMRGNQLERAGLIRRHTLPGRVIVWEVTRAGSFLAGVNDAPTLPRRSGSTPHEMTVAHIGLIHERQGCRIATRRELLTGRYFAAPVRSPFADASTSLELPVRLEIGPGPAHCPDLVLRVTTGSGALSAPMGIALVLDADTEAPQWRAVLDGYQSRRPFAAVRFVTTRRQIARDIGAHLAAAGGLDWVQVKGFGLPKHLSF